ncbi:MAG: hypothetical protein IJ869_00250 [Clostridiales bacterium]|nr:hypothetical protein [Clostridiales bacterium]HAW15539.1 hypothetical protein [Clostridiales bacterium]
MPRDLLKRRNLDNRSIIFLILGSFLISRLILILIHGKFNGGISLETFLRDMNRFDSTWYLFTIQEGYLPSPFGHDAGDAANWAFFPLMPLFYRYLHKVIRIEYILFIPVFNSILFMVAQFFIVKYIMKTRENLACALITVYLFNFGPYTFYFSSMYTESMFLLFAALFLYFMNEKKYLLMGLFGLLASATRNIGVFLVFAPFVMSIREYLENGDGKKNVTGYLKKLFGNADLILGTSLVPAGLFAYMFYLYKLTGDGLAFVHIQRAWNETTDYNFFREMIDALSHIYDAKFYFACWTILGFFAVFYLIVKKRYEEATLCAIFLIIPISVRLISIPRYLIGSLVPVLGWSDLLTDLKPKTVKIPLLIALLFLSFLTFKGWYLAMEFVT